MSKSTTMESAEPSMMKTTTTKSSMMLLFREAVGWDSKENQKETSYRLQVKFHSGIKVTV
jgi:hypothetical protein